MAHAVNFLLVYVDVGGPCTTPHGVMWSAEGMGMPLSSASGRRLALYTPGGHQA